MKDENIYLFVPNLIGYVRIALYLFAFHCISTTNYYLATVCYMLGVVSDDLDGYAARTLKQCTRFGALLDMLTDHISVTCLQAALCFYYPQYILWFQLNIIIDIASHWIHMQSMLLMGVNSHKTLDQDEFWILRVYYENAPFLTFMCIGNDLFFCMVYLCHYTSGPIVSLGLFSVELWVLLGILSAPVAFLKTGIHCIQLYGACQRVTLVDRQERRLAWESKEN